MGAEKEFPVFPYTEAEIAAWPRPAVGMAGTAEEATRLSGLAKRF